MGTGRKTKAIHVSEGSSWSANTSTNGFTAARNLHKADLGGLIFGCKHNTISECLAKQIFGLPGHHMCYIKNVEPGLPLFLFNYSDRMLHGVYESASHGQLNIDPYAWTEDGKEKTPFPAQVRICIKTYCQPVAEKKYRPIIEDNYYTPTHFYFELDHRQTKGLMALFKLTPQLRNGAPPRNNLLTILPTGKGITRPFTEVVKSSGNFKKDFKAPVDLLGGNKFASLLLDDGDKECTGTSKASSSATEDGERKETVSDWEDLCSDNIHTPPTDVSHGLQETQTVFENDPDNSRLKIDKDRVMAKLQKMVDFKFSNPSPRVCGDDFPASSVAGGTYGASVQIAKGQKEERADDSALQPIEAWKDEATYESMLPLSEEQKDGYPSPTMTEFQPENVGLVQVVSELKTRTAVLEKKLIETERELERLRDTVKESDRKNQQLQEHVKELEAKLDPSMALVEESLNESLMERYLGSEKLVYLIGGYNGNVWLNTLDSYSPSLDILTPLKPMSSARSYAAAAALNGCLFVFGGGDGDIWYDTVECYNPRNDEWTLCPSSIRGNGSLAGATLNGKIFAIGGGNGIECFSTVEMFDPALGRWINSQSMLQKRFAPAASELNGVLYAVGGYDGEDYLKSAERFDSRESSWTRLPSMNTKRGCHSLAVFNEKICAVGGYDGEKMVSSIEVFDPRAGSWMMGDPMNEIRGYAGAAVLGDSLFVIGGVKDSESILNTVECYQERVGWMTTGTRAIGNRCFFSAIVL